MISSPIGIIIQARMGSSRLPGKILMPIGQYKLLDHIINRLTYLGTEALLVIATSDTLQDDAVEDFCTNKQVRCFRGSETDVLGRYYQCAQKYGFQQIVRLTGDNPFPDIAELDRLISLHINERADFSCSFGSLPVGVGAEIFTFAALKQSWLEGKAPHHREHVDEYMLENPLIFKTINMSVDPSKSRPDIRLTVDTEEDYRKACYIVSHCSDDYISTEELISIVQHYRTQENL